MLGLRLAAGGDASKRPVSCGFYPNPAAKLAVATGYDGRVICAAGASDGRSTYSPVPSFRKTVGIANLGMEVVGCVKQLKPCGARCAEIDIYGIR